MSKINIRKRDGSLEPLDIKKIKVVTQAACEGLPVSRSELEVDCMFKFQEGMSTERIQEILIDTAKNKITEEQPDWARVAARLISYDLRKRVYGSFEPPKFSSFVNQMMKLGVYDSYIMEQYDDAELDIIDGFIDHSRDDTFSLAAMGQLAGKYLLRDRSRPGHFYETPQMMYMAVACVLMAKYSKKYGREKRLELVKTFYDGVSTFKFSLPTPILAGVRTPTRQFSSCVLIDCDDNLPSINATAAAIVNYVSKRAGIGLNEGRIRAVGSKIRNGEMVHTGVVPFLKYHVGALKSCSQGGIRGGSATAYYPMWHYQIDEILVLKNNRGIEENRERRCDYAIQIGDEMYDRLLKDQHIYCFDPKDVPGLYEAYFEKTNDKFSKLYAQYIQKAEEGSIRFKKIKATELFSRLIDERVETGRIYVMNTQNMNRTSPFLESPIFMSNLCLEIGLPTRPFTSETDESGRIALCTLASYNMSEFITDKQQMDELPKYVEALVFALDSLLDYQDYPMIQAKRATEDWRTLGMGIVNLADFFAQQGMKYGEHDALQAVNKFMRRLTFFAKKATVALARDYGACKMSREVAVSTKMLHDHAYGLDSKFKLDDKDKLDWATLNSDICKYGVRNATLFAVAPTESSSQVLNATNGVEMPRGFISQKGSKDGVFAQIVPSPELRGQYQYVWDQPDPVPYLKTIAVIQRWVDQTISTNTSYNPVFFGGKLKRHKLLEDMILAWKMGIKTLYYNNVPDGASDELDSEQKDPPPSPAGDEICDSCVI
ncbi:putative ribonucleotide-diphosphate reductase alpha subunit [Aeromonas phage phiA8-29]|uniref:Ribonucleoside-diphosphate reductase n=1 Tax=Aeromonas phage phiA8-29 TaxID=1978922 RepID=A0A1W6DYD6_9CAUD|nr:ribonucleotide reductase large subunit [Aeromonas phage phiA8-29]ARK07915.1 putative ribonucleotide-diphosphate reductase alpha subunit [Aeromonas phage phiA8-29]